MALGHCAVLLLWPESWHMECTQTNDGELCKTAQTELLGAPGGTCARFSHRASAGTATPAESRSTKLPSGAQIQTHAIWLQSGQTSPPAANLWGRPTERGQAIWSDKSTSSQPGRPAHRMRASKTPTTMRHAFAGILAPKRPPPQPSPRLPPNLLLYLSPKVRKSMPSRESSRRSSRLLGLHFSTRRTCRRRTSRRRCASGCCSPPAVAAVEAAPNSNARPCCGSGPGSREVQGCAH